MRALRSSHLLEATLSLGVLRGEVAMKDKALEQQKHELDRQHVISQQLRVEERELL